MSTVLWVNTLIDGEVKSNESDLYALYKHSKKLDKLTKTLGTPGFIDSQDFTDYQFNLSGDELPEGMESTDELMAQNGVWIEAADAVTMLQALISHITENSIKFGLSTNDAEAVLTELRESLEAAKKASSAGGKFNFAVVM